MQRGLSAFPQLLSVYLCKNDILEFRRNLHNINPIRMHFPDNHAGQTVEGSEKGFFKTM
jgi:hypothetical protein